MYHYLVTTHGTSGQGHQTFHNKASAVTAFNNGWTFSGSVCLSQGNFTRNGSLVFSHGQTYTLANQSFNSDGELVN